MDYNFKELAEKLPEENKKRLKSLYESADFIIEQIDYTVCEMKEAESDFDRGKLELKLRRLNDTLQNLEFAMQGEWGIEKNSKYHTWWLKPKNCNCPHMDNLDPCFFGMGKIINYDCPVHGIFLEPELD